MVVGILNSGTNLIVVVLFVVSVEREDKSLIVFKQTEVCLIGFTLESDNICEFQTFGLINLKTCSIS